MGSIDGVYLISWSSSDRSYINWLIHPVCPKRKYMAPTPFPEFRDERPATLIRLAKLVEYDDHCDPGLWVRIWLADADKLEDRVKELMAISEGHKKPTPISKSTTDYGSDVDIAMRAQYRGESVGVILSPKCFFNLLCL